MNMNLYGSICLSDIPKDLIQVGTNGKKYLKVKYWNETQAGAPTYKPTQPTATAAQTAAPTQAAAAADQKLPWEL